MKDITKGDVLNLLDELPVVIKNDKRRIAQYTISGIRSYAYGSSSTSYVSNDGKLECEIIIRRSRENIRKAIGEQRYDD